MDRKEAGSEALDNVVGFPVKKREGAYADVEVDPEDDVSYGGIELIFPHLAGFQNMFNRWKCGVLMSEGPNYSRCLRYLIDVHLECLRCGYLFDAIGSEPANFKSLIDDYETITAVVRAGGGSNLLLSPFAFYLRDKMTARALLQVLRDGEGGKAEFLRYESIRKKWESNGALKRSLDVNVEYVLPPGPRAVLFDGAFVVGPDELETLRDQATFNDLKAFARELKNGSSRNIYLFLMDLRDLFPYSLADGEKFTGVMEKLGSDLSLGELNVLLKRRRLVDRGINRYVSAFYYGEDELENVIKRSIAAEWDEGRLRVFEKLSLDLRNSGPNVEMWLSEIRGGDYSNAKKLVAMLESLRENTHFRFQEPPLGRFGLTGDEYGYIRSVAGCG